MSVVVLCWVLVCGVVPGAITSLGIILSRKRELVALLCVMAICALSLFLAMPWGGQQSAIVAYLDHTPLLVLQFSQTI